MSKNYYKRNYIEVLEILTPNFYIDEDSASSGVEVDPLLQIINGHILAADNFGSILNVSSTSSLADISPYFIKQNKKTNINASYFQKNILDTLGVKLGGFGTSALFKTYLDETLLPSIVVNSPSSFTHEYLLDTLSWAYMLNTSGPVYSTSGDISQRLTERFYSDEPFTITDGIEIFSKYLWKNYSSLSSVNQGIVPSIYLSSVGTYTSGTQGLDNLTTLVKIIYNSKFSDITDVKVKESFEDYISTGELQLDTVSKGAFHRLLKSIAITISDANDSVNDLEAIYNIDKCPKYQLPLVADLIGWNLFGEDDASWRLQLRNAVEVYKRKGTKAGIQLAIDSILPSNNFEVSSIISTLYESYLPYIIQYNLATGSEYFKDLSTWTKELANKTGVKYYSSTSLLESIQHVVDYILLELVKEFPKNFIFDNKVFNLSSVYSYRGKIFNIPPYTDEKFYLQCKITSDLLKSLKSKLKCFGVPEGIASSSIDYIKTHTLSSTDTISFNAGFMFYTSSYQTPPNYTTLVNNLSTDSLENIGLWSAKSSWFNIFLNTSDYSFSSLNIEADTGKSIIELARAVDEFSPAHSVPTVALFSDLSDTVEYLEALCNFIEFSQEEFMSCTYESSGVSMRDSSGLAIFQRDDVSSLLVGTSAISAPRNSIRRRGFKNLFTHSNSYDRTGHNQPLVLQLSSGYEDNIFLGYNPSTFSFVEAVSSNLSGVYGHCNTLSCAESFYGVDVSNTYNCRDYIGSVSCAYPVMRQGSIESLLHVFEWELYRKLGQKKIDLNEEIYLSSLKSLNVVDILAEQLYPSAGINAEDYEFGSPLHRLYKDYTKLYGKHNLVTYYETYLSGGPDIFSHIYGSVYTNFDLAQKGSEVDYITSSVSSLVPINEGGGSGLLSVSGATTTIASSLSDVYVKSYELRNASVCSGVELVVTSGTSENNEFSYINIDTSNTSNDLLSGGCILLKSYKGLPRIRFSLENNNFLTPEHTYKIDINSTITKADSSLGGNVLVWIHTGETNGYCWTYNKNGKWVINDIASLTYESVILNSHVVNIPSKISTVNDKCLTPQNNKGVFGITTNDLTLSSLEFNTLNNKISVPEEYYKVSQQVHTSSQDYIVEVFIPPSVNDNTLVLESLKLNDITNKDRASITRDFTIGVSALATSNVVYEISSGEYNVAYPLNKDELYEVFKFFNNIAVGNASRVVADTSAIFLAEGGSRLNYRLHPDWVSSAAKSANDQYTEIDMEESCTA
jgi:hypothetical protein